eukprot:15328818-Ditylum_brightwellii.AAC.1
MEQYRTVYHEWIALPTSQKRYLNFKTRFNREYQLQNQVDMQQNANIFHQANNAEEENEYEQEAFNDAAQNFTEANAANNSAFVSQIQTNQQLNMQIGALQQQMALMAMLIQQQNNMQQQSSNCSHHQNRRRDNNHYQNAQ